MGMHFGLLAAKAPLSQFRNYFSEVWPQLEIAASADRFSDADAIWSWKSAHEEFVPAANWSKEGPGAEVYVFCQDGPWAVLMDFSYVLAGDEDALEKLSAQFGTVVSFVVETAGGCAYFWCYESGQLRRMIQSVDGEIASSGTPLPEESGIDGRHYYMDETEKLMRALGFSAVEELPVVSTAVAISTIDRTDYGQVLANLAGKKPSNTKPSEAVKSWWKFW
jgi:hypothetical protein